MGRPTIPGYTLQGVLGGGATSVVWRAERESDHGAVAVKVSREPLRGPDRWVSGWSAGPQDAEAVLRELGWLRDLRLPGVVGLQDALVLDDQRLVLVLDLAEGGSLRDLVHARTHLTSDETAAIIGDLAGTLADLHARGVVHGDLSPGNVLLDADGRALVSDLGTASALGDLVDDPWGTDGFVAPELTIGEDPSPRSDVWSLGSLGWYSLVGEPRQVASDPLELAGRVPEAAPGLVDLLGRCLSPAPGDRPTAEEVRDALAVEERGTVDVGLAPRPEEVTRRIREQAAAQTRAQQRAQERAAKLEAVRLEQERPRLVRRRTLAMAAAAGLTLGVAGGAVWLDRRPPDHIAAPSSRPAGVVRDGRTAAPASSASSSSAPSVPADPPRGPGPSVVPQPPPPPASTPSGLPSGAPARSGRTDPVTRADGAVQDPVHVVQALLDARAQAVMARDPEALARAEVLPSSAWRQDRRTVAELRRLGQAHRGLRFQVGSARVVGETGGEVVVRAAVALDDYSWSVPGAPARTVSGHPAREADYVLRRTTVGWRLAAVQAPAETG